MKDIITVLLDDGTNICQIPILSMFIMEKFGKGFYYMQDPYDTALSAMSDVDKIGAPQLLLKLIEESRDEKKFIEKYGSNAVVDLLTIIGIAGGLVTFNKVKKIIYER